MDSRRIIMNFTVSPNLEDIEVISAFVLESLPEELLRYYEGLSLLVEDVVDEVTEQELELDDTYDLLALFKSGKEISPGIEKKMAESEDILYIYRRPVLDVWCETGEDLTVLIRQIMIEELGRQMGFSEEDVEEMCSRHYQGLL